MWDVIVPTILEMRFTKIIILSMHMLLFISLYNEGL